MPFLGDRHEELDLAKLHLVHCLSPANRRA
jgi:hypothetical protein